MSYYINNNLVISDKSAYIHETFRQTPLASTYTQRIDAFNGVAYDQFGTSVAVGCGRIVVGSPLNDEWGSNTGAIYIYDLEGNFKNLAYYFGGGVTTSNLKFGGRVAVSSGVILGYRSVTTDYVNIFDLNGRYIGSQYGSAPNRMELFDVYGGYIYFVSGSFGSSTLYRIPISGGMSSYVNYVPMPNDYDSPLVLKAGCGRIIMSIAEFNNFQAGGHYLNIMNMSGGLVKRINFPNTYWDGIAVGCGRVVVTDDVNDISYLYDINGNLITTLNHNGRTNMGRKASISSGFIALSGDGNVIIYDLNGNLLKDYSVGFSASSISIGSGKLVVGDYLADFKGTNSGSVYVYNLPEDSNTYWEGVLETYRY